MRVVRPWESSMRCIVECCFPMIRQLCCGPTHPSYLMITSTTYASRYGPLKFELPSNRLHVNCWYRYNIMCMGMTTLFKLHTLRRMTSFIIIIIIVRVHNNIHTNGRVIQLYLNKDTDIHTVKSTDICTCTYATVL